MHVPYAVIVIAPSTFYPTTGGTLFTTPRGIVSEKGERRNLRCMGFYIDIGIHPSLSSADAIRLEYVVDSGVLAMQRVPRQTD